MGIIRSDISVSLDGYVAGPDQGKEHPLGVGGERLHDWVLRTAKWNELHGHEGGEPGPDSDIVGRLADGIGAYVMGRNMFGPGRGGWDESWRGPWGDEPPFRRPVFVLTHHERAPLEMHGGTTFTFVTGGLREAVERAREAAKGGDVAVPGGAQTINQFLAAGLLEELTLHVVPILLGGGERLLADVGARALDQLEVIAGDGVTHLRYRVRN